MTPLGVGGSSKNISTTRSGSRITACFQLSAGLRRRAPAQGLSRELFNLETSVELPSHDQSRRSRPSRRGLRILRYASLLRRPLLRANGKNWCNCRYTVRPEEAPSFGAVSKGASVTADGKRGFRPQFATAACARIVVAAWLRAVISRLSLALSTCPSKRPASTSETICS